MTSYLGNNQIKALIATFDVVTTLVFNLSILIVLSTSRKLKKDVFSRGILSLSIADIGFGALCPLLSAIIAWIGPDATHPPELYAFHKYIAFAFALASVWNLALVSIVKCRIIINPLVIMSDKTINGFICGVWIACLGVAGILFLLCNNFSFDWSLIISQGDLMSNIKASLTNNIALKYLFFYIWIIPIFTLPGITMVCVYGKIFTVVLKQVRMIQPMIITIPDETGRNSTVWKQSVKSAKNLFIICVAYFMNYIPYLISMLLLSVSFPAWYHFGAYWLYQYSGAVNGFLYIILNRSVRAEMRNTFLCRSERPVYDFSENQIGNPTIDEGTNNHVILNKSSSVCESGLNSIKEETSTSVQNFEMEFISHTIAHR